MNHIYVSPFHLEYGTTNVGDVSLTNIYECSMLKGETSSLLVFRGVVVFYVDDDVVAHHHQQQQQQ